jgi:GMP synthase PP-ATPase subunit
MELIMNFIQCNSSCVYQDEGYCKLEKAAEITNQAENYNKGCLHYVEKENKYNSKISSEQPRMPL